MTLIAMGLSLTGWAARTWPPPARDFAVALAGEVARASARRRRAVMANLVGLGGASANPRLRAACRSTFRNLVRCSADAAALPRMSPNAILGWLDVVGLENLDDARLRGQGVVLVTAHLGNFELCGVGLAALGVRGHVVSERINPSRDAAFDAIRTATGTTVIPHAGSARRAVQVLHAGGIVGLAGDRALTSRARMIVPCGRGHRPVPLGPAWMALRSGAIVCVTYAVLGGSRRYQLVVEDPIDVHSLGADRVRELTRRIAARLGAAAERYPDQWFVFDPEWQDPIPEVPR